MGEKKPILSGFVKYSCFERECRCTFALVTIFFFVKVHRSKYVIGQI